MPTPTSTATSSLLVLLLLLPSAASALPTHFAAATIPRAGAGAGRESPLTPKASLLRYWSRKIPNNLPKPAFLLSKASPLSAPDAALYERLAAGGSLLSRLRPFCAAARLHCFPDLSPELDGKGASGGFSRYADSNFTNYGTGKTGGLSSFSNYSDDANGPFDASDSFRRYSRRSASHDDRFAFYAPAKSQVTADFTSYAASAASGHGDFASYGDSSLANDLTFTNYDAAARGRLQTFTSYADNSNDGDQSFSGYGKGSTSTPTSFATYGTEGSINLLNSTFSNYGESATNPNDTFTTYTIQNNGPQNDFSSYADGANGVITQSFGSYRDQSNVGEDSFQSYGKHTAGAHVDFGNYGESSNVGADTFKGYGDGEAVDPTMAFKTYGNHTNVPTSTFSSYAESASNPNGSFTSYASNSNVPETTFSSYADGAEGAVSQSFTSYRDKANLGDDSFQSYAKHTTKAHVDFGNYGQSANVGTDTFKGYGKGGAVDPTVTFKTYGPNTTFSDYTKAAGATVTFADYRNTTSPPQSASLAVARGGHVTNRWVEPGKFFRESQLRRGTVMPMPDIRDKMPPRSFLPRSISAHMPFSSARLGELAATFNATAGTALWKSMAATVAECERAPSAGETKRCAASVEDMIDFATAVLGSDVAVRSTATSEGRGGDVEIGEVRGINVGRVTRSVSCHQSLFPYMVYYCHSVPKVRLYEAEILAVGSGKAINRGVAICHLDTSAWSEGHGAFVALGPGPGKIEVCHWIFQGDMTWAAAD